MPENADRFRAARTAGFTESVIREMTRLALRHNPVNLAQGFPDFPAPQAIKEAAARAIAEDRNQYAVTSGAGLLPVRSGGPGTERFAFDRTQSSCCNCK